MSDRSTWVQFEEFDGGITVACALCGRRGTRKVFRASYTNYAEMRRLATAYHSQHSDSEMHAAALAAYHDDPPPTPASELRLSEVFKVAPPTLEQRRRAAAKLAARITAQGSEA